MKRLALPFLLALLSVFFAIPSCSTVAPYIKPVTSCAGKSVSADDVNEAFNDLLTQNWADLAAEGVRVGFDVLDCIISDITNQAPGLKPSATEFKTLHAVEFRAAGVSACREPDLKANPGDRLPGAGPASGGAPRVPLAGSKMFSYPGENVGTAEARCEAACGERDAIGSPGGDCLCLRGRTWVAAR